jgi:hypothetical protein
MLAGKPTRRSIILGTLLALVLGTILIFNAVVIRPG